MVAFQAVDPGSIPGHRSRNFERNYYYLKFQINDTKNNRAYQGSNLESSAFHHHLTVGRRVIHCATGPWKRCESHSKLLNDFCFPNNCRVGEFE